MSQNQLRALLASAAGIVVSLSTLSLLADPDASQHGAGPMLLAAAAGVAAAAALLAVFEGHRTRTLARLRAAIDALASDTVERPPRAAQQGEFAGVASSLDAMAERIELRLDEATSEKEQLEAVLAAMVEGVLVLDASGRMQLANPRLRELLDAWGRIEGRHPLEVVRNAHIDRVLADAAAASGIVVREIEGVGPEQRTLRMHARGFPAAGTRAGTVAVFHDVSELRRLEQVRRDFIANASHELRTPLTSIQGFAATLLAAPGDAADLRGPLEAIERNAERLSALVEDLLELSRIESRRAPLRPSEVDLARCCEVLTEDAAPRLREAQIELRLELESEPTVAWADRGAIDQVISNLLDNAIKYTEAGGRIVLRTAGRGERVEVAVEDTGIGIPEVDQPRIFERFYRVDPARSRALGGTGLGLSIVKHLAQAMGGEIFVTSTPGKGSRFVLDLPRAPEEPASTGS